MSNRRGPIETLSAVTLVTADMAASADFYGALGFRLAYGGRAASFTCLRSGSSYLNLQLVPEASPVVTVWGRVIFWVDNVDEMYARALAAGYQPSTEPADAAWGERFFHIRDPHGHELSFAKRLA